MLSEAAAKYIDEKIANGEPFAIFRLPGEKDFHEAGTDEKALYINTFNAPFSDIRNVCEAGFELPVDVSVADTSKKAYLEAVTELAELHKREGGKTVLSRVITGQADVVDPGERIMSFFETNPDAFCMVLLTIGRKLTVMATPELLLKVKAGRFETMALAGTRVATDHPVPWDAKNIAEQQMVTDFITSELQKHSIKTQISKTYTKRSNNIEHICTEIEGIVESVEGNDVFSQAGRVIDILSPTPAVCGLPRDKALKNIACYEKHPRDFYAGYTLVTLPDDEIRAYVNLRCAHVDLDKKKFVIISGGGITAESTAHAEYSETAMKGKPLSKIFVNKL